MLDVRVLTEYGITIAELKTTDLNIATDFIQGQIDKVFYEHNENRIGLYDKDYGFYCIVTLTDNELFEIMALDDDEPNGNRNLYDTKEYMIHLLEKEFELGGDI